MNIQQDRTLQEAATSLSVPDVISAAKIFFARRNNIYAAFVEKEGPSFVSLRGQGGEEVLIGAVPASQGGGTRVTVNDPEPLAGTVLSFLVRASDLLAEPEPGPTPMLVDGMLVDRCLGAIVGRWKHGKTWGVLELAIAVASGEFPVESTGFIAFCAIGRGLLLACTSVHIFAFRLHEGRFTPQL